MTLRSRVIAALLVGLASPAAIAAGFGPHHNPAPGERSPASAAALPVDGLQQRLVKAVKTVSAQVVVIQSPFGLGSGVVFDNRGDVVTNAHVVRGSRRFVVRLSGGERRAAVLLGADQRHDIAVVRLVGPRPPGAKLARSVPTVGSLVLAIGNPLGLRSSVTQGIVSSLDRSVAEDDGVTLKPVIQTSAEISPGSSGGALVDLAGRVIGITTLAVPDPELADVQAPRVGFAIPNATVIEVAKRLIGAV
jgi:S1-C subfamily serine protease